MTSVANLTIRPLEPSDYIAYARINNAYYPDSPTTPEFRRHKDETRPEALAARVFAAESGGTPVAFGTIQNAIWYGEGRVSVQYAIDEAWSGTPLEGEFFRFLLREAGEGAHTLYTWLDERHANHVATVQAEGFNLALRVPVTVLDLSAYESSGFKAEAEGIQIRSLASLREQEDWIKRFYALHAAIQRDLPAPEPIQPTPFDVFEKWVVDPMKYDLEGAFVAIEGDEWVGLTELRRHVANRSLGQTGLTGVLGSHRRRGIATALKATALAWAKDHGVARVLTDNEENNPMLQLNYALGFRDAYALLQYQRTN